MEEIWVKINGFEDYMISNLGKIKSFKRNALGYLLKPTERNEYLSVFLINNEIRKRVSLHRLVAEHFVENPHNLKCVNHINGIKTDNRAINLEWCTHKDNTNHYYNVLKKGELIRDLPINQFTREGEFIKRWDNIKSASRELDINICSILYSCRRRIKHQLAGGYMWRFINDNDLNLNYKRFRSVVQINRYGEFVQVFTTTQDAGKAMGVQGSDIWSVCSKNTNYAKGFIWRYKDEYKEDEFGYYLDKTFIQMMPNGIFVNKYKGTRALIDSTNLELVKIIKCCKDKVSTTGGYKWCIEEESNISRPQKRRKAIICLDKNMNFICEYDSLTDGANAVNVQPTHISICCRNPQKSAGGYRWMYKDDYIHLIENK